MPVSFASVVLAGSLALTPAHRASSDSLRSAHARLRPSPAQVELMAPIHGPSGPLPLRGLATPVSFGEGGFLASPEAATAPEPQLIEYSDAYFTRLTIHRWASYLTLPLFASEFIVGQKLVHGHDTQNLRSVHRALAGGIGALFVVNTVTGGLNALEARKDPTERNRRTLHSVLMLLSDAGFVATAVLAKSGEDEGGSYTGPLTSNAHRNMAIASMGTALIGYAIMLPFFRKD